ncbi:MAG: CDP-diacylglycerol--serine O-phosphatidyltransferase [Saprospiraceae bacterium]|nr:CDP-diacylglycerol--serine O-phosphatidyltransferase [Saprospiraceae bacterium]
MNIRAFIPNALTMANLYCGCCAIIAILNDNFDLAFWLLIIAGIFDFADGLVARALNVSSDMGKELDSLADVVSFGVVPGTFYYVLLLKSSLPQLALLGYVITIFSALRLAKFNLDTRQTTDFIGLNTPSNTFFVVGYAFAYFSHNISFLLEPYTILLTIAITSYLLVSEIRMFGFKIKTFGLKENILRIVFIVLSLLAIVGLGKSGFGVSIILYVLINIIFYSKKYV